MAKNEKKYPKKAKVHTIYRNLNGDILPGVSTISGARSGQGKTDNLIGWAVNLFKLGFDHKRIKEHSGDVGTLAHYLINCELTGKEPDYTDWSFELIEAAKIPFSAFMDWYKRHKVETLLTEGELVSNAYNFGGTIDWFGKIDGVVTLGDFKTSGGIYDSYWEQLAGYELLLMENGFEAKYGEINDYRIWRFSKEGAFEEGRQSKEVMSLYRKIFLNDCDSWWKEHEIEKLKYRR